MRGDRVVDEGVLYESVWDGSHQGKDLDLLVPIEAPKPEPAQKKRRITRQQAYEAVLDCLTSTSARLWRTEKLREEADLTPCEFETALNVLRREGTVLSVQRGIVALRVKVAA